MRVLFATAIIAAIANAGGAPSVKGNSAKRNFGNEAPSRYEQTKSLIKPDQARNNSGQGDLSIQVVLKADDNDRKRNELHTSLTLAIDDLAVNNEVYMGWAMRVSKPTEIEDTAEGNPDGQGTDVVELRSRASKYGGLKGWDGISAYQTYKDGE